MITNRLASLLGRLLVSAIAWAPGAALAIPVTQVFLEGDSLPQDQGWSRFSTATAPVVSTDGVNVVVNTVGAPSDSSGPAVFVYRDLGVDLNAPYEIEATLRVLESSYNAFDSAVALYGSYGGPTGNFTGTGRDRELFIFFGVDEIGWGDLSQIVAFDTTDSFHTYVLAVEPSGVATLSVDGDVMLSRTDFEVSRARMAFGDSTNDPGVDGSFLISSITVTGKPAVAPEPGAGLLLAVAASSCLLAAPASRIHSRGRRDRT